MTDHRKPVRARHVQAYLPHSLSDDRPSLVLALEEGPQQAEVLRRLQENLVCSFCGIGWPARPCRGNLPLFEPVSAHVYPHDDATVRELIRNEHCPLCRAPSATVLTQGFEVEDRWSEEAVQREIARAEKDAAENPPDPEPASKPLEPVARGKGWELHS